MPRSNGCRGSKSSSPKRCSGAVSSTKATGTTRRSTSRGPSHSSPKTSFTGWSSGKCTWISGITPRRASNSARSTPSPSATYSTTNTNRKPSSSSRTSRARRTRHESLDLGRRLRSLGGEPLGARRRHEHVVFDPDAQALRRQVDPRLEGEHHPRLEGRAVVPDVVDVHPEPVAQAVNEVRVA